MHLLKKCDIQKNVCRRKTFLMSSPIMPRFCMTHTVKKNKSSWFGSQLQILQRYNDALFCSKRCIFTAHIFSFKSQCVKKVSLLPTAKIYFLSFTFEFTLKNCMKQLLRTIFTIQLFNHRMLFTETYPKSISLCHSQLFQQR